MLLRNRCQGTTAVPLASNWSQLAGPSPQEQKHQHVLLKPPPLNKTHKHTQQRTVNLNVADQKETPKEPSFKSTTLKHIKTLVLT